jgi:hypothetical protein
MERFFLFMQQQGAYIVVPDSVCTYFFFLKNEEKIVGHPLENG